ncbi:hypothetical protein A3K72_02035 [Candidatus Woesearchaeota archaeon RBG_13_36_6]|nr:MAG: hypothetical protein A3K72_02035 [Candidatus Woesearchaeota archaeon RBG_13_36_6]
MKKLPKKNKGVKSFFFRCALNMSLTDLIKGNGHIKGLNRDHLREMQDYFTDPEEKALFQKACDFAYENLRSVLRDNGDSFLAHMVESTYILHTEIRPICEEAGIKLSVLDYVALMIHDVHEECKDVYLRDIGKMFGKEVYRRIDAMSTEATGIDRHRKGFDKVIGTAGDIPSVPLLKLGDRTHNVRTLYGKEEWKQMEIAADTRMRFVPLARYLGFEAIAQDLDDLSRIYTLVDEDKYRESDTKIIGMLEKNGIRRVVPQYALEASPAMVSH